MESPSPEKAGTFCPPPRPQPIRTSALFQPFVVLPQPTRQLAATEITLTKFSK